jgi:hypothetical protein
MVIQRSIKFIVSCLILAVIMIAVFYQIYRQIYREPTQLEPEIAQEKNLDTTALPASVTNPAPAQTPTISPPENTKLPPQNMAAPHVEISDAWQIGDTFTDSAFSLHDSVIVYATITIDMEKPYYPQPGEQLDLHLPGDLSVRADVRSSHLNPNGDYSWRGHLNGYDNEYPIVMTYGQNSVFATVTTPQGSYTLESINGRGWIYKNPAEFELSEPDATDYLEIPHTHD